MVLYIMIDFILTKVIKIICMLVIIDQGYIFLDNVQEFRSCYTSFGAISASYFHLDWSVQTDDIKNEGGSALADIDHGASNDDDDHHHG